MSWFHRHRFELVDVHHGTNTKHGGNVTVLLKRCRCADFTSVVIDGHWTRQQLGAGKWPPPAQAAPPGSLIVEPKEKP